MLVVLMDMRRYRAGLIQTPDQLRFSYLAIIDALKRTAAGNQDLVSLAHHKNAGLPFMNSLIQFNDAHFRFPDGYLSIDSHYKMVNEHLKTYADRWGQVHTGLPVTLNCLIDPRVVAGTS